MITLKLPMCKGSLNNSNNFIAASFLACPTNSIIAIRTGDEKG